MTRRFSIQTMTDRGDGVDVVVECPEVPNIVSVTGGCVTIYEVCDEPPVEHSALVGAAEPPDLGGMLESPPRGWIKAVWF